MLRFRLLKKALGAFLCGISLAVLAAPVPNEGIELWKYIENPAAEDHSPYVQKAMGEAARRHRPLLVMGGRTYRLKKTIDISGVPEILGQGQPDFVMSDPAQDIFFSKNIWRIRIEGLTFRGGRDQIAIGNRNIDRGHMVISNCRFVRSNGVAVRFLKDTASTLCIVEKCAFDSCMQTLVTVSDHCHFSDSWVTSAVKNPRNLAVIENHNYLSCNNILGVPLVNDSDLRWIDNWGHTLSCRNFRFGGEGGGFTPVVNYKKYMTKGWGAQILLEDCYLGNQGNSAKKAVVYCYEFPNTIIIRDSMLHGIPPVMLDAKLKLKGYFAEANPGMIRLDVADNTGEFVRDVPQDLVRAIADVQKGNQKNRDHILSETLTAQALKRAVAKAKTLPSDPQPLVMERRGKVLHRQRTAPEDYQSITMKTHEWDLQDYLDGMKERCGDQLAVGDVGESTVIMARMDKPTWPHVLIRDVTVDLEQFPILSFKLKDSGCAGGHIAVRVVDKATKKASLIMEDYQKTCFRYQAFDLRKVFGRTKGKVTFDIKFYLCGCRITTQGAVGKNGVKYMSQGEFFIVDFMRLEKP